METVVIKAEINKVDIPLLEALLKKFKAKSVEIEEKEPTEMSKEDYKKMLIKAKKSGRVQLSSQQEDLLFQV